MKHLFTWQFVRYALVGVLNTLLNLAVFNFLMVISGITRGPYITLFAVITFSIVITHAFFWNKYLVFRMHESARAHREYVAFFAVSGTTALINTAIVSLLVNGIGALWGISPHLWANIAVLITIPVAVLGNYFGYKIFVFKETTV